MPEQLRELGIEYLNCDANHNNVDGSRDPMAEMIAPLGSVALTAPCSKPMIFPPNR